MGNGNVLKEIKKKAENNLIALDNKINETEKIKYDHYAIFLIDKEIKFTLKNIKKLKKTPKEQKEIETLVKNHNELRKKYENIRGDLL